jgi:hypothetical protein
MYASVGGRTLLFLVQTYVGGRPLNIRFVNSIWTYVGPHEHTFLFQKNLG